MQIVYAYITVTHWCICTNMFDLIVLFGILSGVWNMRDKTLYQGATVKYWGLLVYGQGFSRNRIDFFKNSLNFSA